MSYIRSKMINGSGPYYYEVEGHRGKDGKVRQKVIKYIGKDKPGVNGEKVLGTTTENELIKDAKKYKTPDEFINNSGELAYHGTQNVELETFDFKSVGTHTDSGMWGEGIYFTNDKKYAETYAYREGKPGKLITARLQFKNPYVIKNKEDIPVIVVPKKTMDDLKNSDKNYSRMFTEHLKSRGYDGVIREDGDYREYVVFSGEQIKTEQQLTEAWNKSHKKGTV